ncbi:sister chromatid cohesion protein 1, partial [Ascosphaera acerosa]
MGPGDGDADGDTSMNMSIEVGRDAPAPRPVGEDLFSDRPLDGELDLDIDGLDKRSVLGLGRDNANEADIAGRDDTLMAGMDDTAMNLGFNDESTILPDLHAEADADQQHGPRSRSATPLSEARSSVVRELEDEVTRLDLEMADGEAAAEAAAQGTASATAPLRAKRRRLLPADDLTFLTKEQLRHQREDRSRILLDPEAAPTDLSRDAALLALASMHKAGALAAGVMLGGLAGAGVGVHAPQLRELLSASCVQKAGELKRKRAPVEGEPAAGTGEDDLALQLNHDESTVLLGDGLGVGDESTFAIDANNATEIEIPAYDAAADDQMQAPFD